MKENKKIVAHYWRLIINPDVRFEVTNCQDCDEHYSNWRLAE